MDGAADGSAFPYSGQREQLQMQFQQQLQAQQQQHMHQELQQSHAMDGIGPASSTIMQVHSGDTSAAMHMTSAPMQLAPMQTRSSDAVAATSTTTGSFVNPPPQRQQSGAKRVGTLITGGEEPGMPQLYKTSKMRRPELWQFIRLVVPDPPHIAAGRTYTNQDAKEAYCLKCKRIMHYNTGSSNNVSRHMAKFHAAELASYAQEMANKKIKNKKQQDRGTYVQTSGEHAGGSASSSPSAGHKRRRTEIITAPSIATNINTTPSESPMDGPRLSMSLSDELHVTGDEDSKEELTQEETEHLNAIMARWVAKHHHPFSITEDPELQELLRFAATLRKPITLPPPSSVRASVQSLSARTRMDLMRQISSEVLFYSMASEVWITVERDIFVSFSIHYLTENFERRHFTLDVREHSGHQVFSYETKRDMLYTLISRWNLDPRYLSSMLWQSQPRVEGEVNTMTQPRTQQAESAAHGFEIILAPLLHGPRELEADGMQVFFFDEMVNNAIANVAPEYQASVQFVRNQVTMFRDLAFFLTNHPRAVVRLSKLTSGTSQQRLVTDSKASWLSTLDMLKRLVKKRDVIRDFFAYADTIEGRAEFQNLSPSASPSPDNNGMHRQEPTDEQWCAIECLLQLLQPFENVALAIGKEKYAASSLTFPLLKFLKRDLEKVTNFQRIFAKYASSQVGGDAQSPLNFQAQAQNIAAQLEIMRNFLYTEFKAHFTRACGELMWVSQLDPRFVRMKYLSDEEREVCKARLIDQCFVLANFNQVMTSQRIKASADVVVSAGLDPSSASFLDFQTGMQPTREDSDTNSFLRELLFDDAHDDPALVYQQQQQQLLHQQGQLGDSLGPAVTVSVGDAAAAGSAACLEQEAALRLRVVDEVKAYYAAVAAAKVTAMRDPLKWWRDNTAAFPLLVPLARQWLSSVGSVRPSEAVQIGAGSHGDLTTTATSQGVQVSASTGAALPYGMHAVHSEPELVRDLMFVHDNC
ncbi:Long chain acyl-CoA synthetase 7 [Phytophthora cinnamomi]|nr:Long chain acyl-CoA synthetase 7 [Phytophthora cinnamomi]